jgi:hypothetical protein
MTYLEAVAILVKRGVNVRYGENLYSLGWYLSWHEGDELATLDGDFTAQELQAIAVYMQGPQT